MIHKILKKSFRSNVYAKCKGSELGHSLICGVEGVFSTWDFDVLLMRCLPV